MVSFQIVILKTEGITMNHSIKYITFIFILFWLSKSAQAQEFSELLKTQLQTENLYQRALVNTFYETRNFEPVWNRTIDASIFISALFCASDEGLNPYDYHFSSLQRLAGQQAKKFEEQVTFEVLLTDAFIHYGFHLAYGKVDPSKIYPREWGVYNRTILFTDVLQKALDEKAIIIAIETLRPNHIGYKKLQHELLKFKNLQAKTRLPSITEEGVIEPNTNDPRIRLIRERLQRVEQFFAPPLSDTCNYDSVLVMAVKNFQQKHGLVTDGIIGKQTFAVLNTSLEKYIQKIRINMERYRWLPEQLGQHYISINIPDFHAEVMATDTLVMRMKTIVGRPERKTPVLNSELRYLIINPTWTVPPTILKEDALPAIRRNINYLTRNNLKVINRNGEEVNPYTLPWYKYNERNFPYQLVQDPGPSNSLGLIKFQFPNNHRVFLHDTNSHGLFAATYRALSSGCIRIEHPFTLAAYLLTDTNWTEEKLNKLITSKKTTTITIPLQMAIHIFYFTAFVNNQNEIQFRNDIYGWDEILTKYFPAELNLY